jgi:hypothetical protein
MFSRTQSCLLLLGLAAFMALAGSRVFSESGRALTHDRSAKIDNTFLDFTFAGLVEVNEDPLVCLYRIPVLNIKRFIRPGQIRREIYIDQFRVAAQTSHDRNAQTSFDRGYSLSLSFPQPDVEVEKQVGPIEFSIPKPALPRNSGVTLALTGTEVLRNTPLPTSAYTPNTSLDPAAVERGAMWPIVVPSNQGDVRFIPDAPNDYAAAAVGWKTPSDIDDPCSSERIY